MAIYCKKARYRSAAFAAKNVIRSVFHANKIDIKRCGKVVLLSLQIYLSKKQFYNGAKKKKKKKKMFSTHLDRTCPF